MLNYQTVKQSLFSEEGYRYGNFVFKCTSAQDLSFISKKHPNDLTFKQESDSRKLRIFLSNERIGEIIKELTGQDNDRLVACFRGNGTTANAIAASLMIGKIVDEVKEDVNQSMNSFGPR